MRTYRLNFDGHQYTLYSTEDRQVLENVEAFIHQREQIQPESLSSHQKAVLMLTNLALDYLKLQEENEKLKNENQQLQQRVARIRKDSIYDLVLDDLHHQVEDELEKARMQNKDSAIMGARYVLNHLSKEQIKRKK